MAEDVIPDSGNYYAFLNVQRNATPAEITAAYRRMSSMFHPDRHSTDPELKKKAEDLFIKTQEAYKVLSDPNKRAIYDAVGEPGLEVEGWEIVERRYHPNEIREEYERLKQLREEQLKLQRTNPSGKLEVTLNACELFQHYEYDSEFPEYYSPYQFPFVEVAGISAFQSIEAPVTPSDRLIFGGSLDTKNGVGNGSVSLTWRKILQNQMWCETDCSLREDTSLAFSSRIVRTFTNKMHGSAQAYTHIDRSGALKPGIALGLTRQLDHDLNGTITLKLGAQNAVTTGLVYDDSLRTRFIASVTIGVPAFYGVLGCTYRFTENDAKAKAVVKYGNIGTIFELSYERRISSYNLFGATCRIHLPRGVMVRLKLQRAAQVYQANILLCEDEVLPSAIIWGSIVPVLVYNIGKAILEPWLERRRLRQIIDKQRNSSSFTEERRKAAQAAIELMTDTAERSKDTERKRNGLIIVEAWYGQLVTSSITTTHQNGQRKVFDVMVPLQALVKDSKLAVFEASKANLAGFYDPCPGEEKSLKVVYRFRDQLHSVVVPDSEPLAIPKQSHLIKNGGSASTTTILTD